jgi:mannose-6-phosphate isomerase-like protein (cupin superfamily)
VPGADRVSGNRRQRNVSPFRRGHNEQVVDHDERPWGTYTVLDDALGHRVERIVVNAGKRLSYQRHARRAEHWFIVQGDARVTLDGARSN